MCGTSSIRKRVPVNPITASQALFCTTILAARYGSSLSEALCLLCFSRTRSRAFCAVFIVPRAGLLLNILKTPDRKDESLEVFFIVVCLSERPLQFPPRFPPLSSIAPGLYPADPITSYIGQFYRIFKYWSSGPHRHLPGGVQNRATTNIKPYCTTSRVRIDSGIDIDSLV